MTLNSCSNNFVKIKPLDLVHIVILPGKSDKIDALFQAIIALLFQFTSQTFITVFPKPLEKTILQAAACFLIFFSINILLAFYYYFFKHMQAVSGIIVKVGLINKTRLNAAQFWRLLALPFHMIEVLLQIVGMFGVQRKVEETLSYGLNNLLILIFVGLKMVPLGLQERRRTFFPFFLALYVLAIFLKKRAILRLIFRNKQTLHEFSLLSIATATSNLRRFPFIDFRSCRSQSHLQNSAMYVRNL